MAVQPVPDDTPATPIDEVIGDLNQLSAAVRRLGNARSRVREIRLTAKREHERVDLWVQDETVQDLMEIEYQEGLISAFARQEAARQAAKGGRKRVTSPWGACDVRALPEEYHGKDTKGLLEWALDDPDRRFVKAVTTETLDWAKLKAACRRDGDHLVLLATGERIPWVEVVDREDSVAIRPYTDEPEVDP